jgi:hemerythrin-like domain-containing protein
MTTRATNQRTRTAHPPPAASNASFGGAVVDLHQKNVGSAVSVTHFSLGGWRRVRADKTRPVAEWNTIQVNVSIGVPVDNGVRENHAKMRAATMSTEPKTKNEPLGAPHHDSFRLPIEFLFSEHDRHRVICATLDRLAEDCTSEDAQDNAQFVLSYLENDMPLHIADEEEDLFPILKRCCEPDDELDYILELLREEHEADEDYYLSLLEPLRLIASGMEPTDIQIFGHMARTFATFHRRHLGWENGTVLPLARKRMSAADQAELGRRMAARR